jgi:FMN reductase
MLISILGSATPPGRLHRALSEALDRASEPPPIDLSTQRIAWADGRPPAELDDDTESVVECLGRADAVLLATPVYRGSLTGVLKNLLDHLPVDVLRGKPVAVAAMGATDQHYLGADRHLRDLMAFFGAHTLPTAAYLTSADFDSTGRAGPRAAQDLDELIAAAQRLVEALRRRPLLGPPPLLAR